MSASDSDRERDGVEEDGETAADRAEAARAWIGEPGGGPAAIPAAIPAATGSGGVRVRTVAIAARFPWVPPPPTSARLRTRSWDLDSAASRSRPSRHHPARHLEERSVWEIVVVVFLLASSRFLVKTCTAKERDVLLDILGEYSKHASEHRGTSLLPQYYGLYTIEVGSRSAHFIIMELLVRHDARSR